MKESTKSTTQPVSRAVAETTGNGLSFPAVVPPMFVLQRVISDKDPIVIADAEWTTVQANEYITRKGLTDKAWPAENAEPFTKTDVFVNEIIVEEVLRSAKADGIFNEGQIAVAAKTRLTNTLENLKKISDSYTSVQATLRDNEYDSSKDRIGEEEELVGAWEKMILDRTAVLAGNGGGDAVTEIKAMIRFAQNFSIAEYKFQTIQQMSFLLKDHPGKQAFYADFEYVLGSSFHREPDRDVLTHKINAMVNLNSHGIVPEAETNQAYLLRLMTELEPVLRGLELTDMEQINASLRFTIIKVQQEIKAKEITIENIDERITDVKLVGYKPLMRKILAADTGNYIKHTHLERDRININDLKLIANHAAAVDINAVTDSNLLSKDQMVDIKEKTATPGVSEKVSAALSDAKRGIYGKILTQIRDNTITSEIYLKLMADYELATVMRDIHFYLMDNIRYPEAPEPSYFESLKTRLLTKEGSKKAIHGGDIEKHLEERNYIFRPDENIEKFNKIIAGIQSMEFDPTRFTAFKATESAVPATPLAFTPALIQSIGKAATGVDLSGGYLNAVFITPDEDPVKINKLALFMRFAPKETLVEEMKTIISDRPEILPALNNKLFKLRSVDLNAGGGIESLSGITSRALLDASRMSVDAGKWSDNATGIKDKIAEDHAVALPEEVTELLAKGTITPGVDAHILGRTVIVPKGGKGIGIKLLKESESESDFNKELGMQKFLADKKATLGLISDYPTALGTFEMGEADFEKLSDLIITGIAASKAAATSSGEPPVKDIALHAADKTVMLYEAPWPYFIYENRAGLTAVLPDLNLDETIKTGRQKFFTDAMKLLKEGIGFPQLIDLNHNSDRIYNWMIDVIRMYGGVLQGMGRIDNWKSAARYPNIRASGLADVGDSVALSDMEYDQGTEHSTNEAESAHGKVWTTLSAQKHKMLIAQYFGSYLLSSILAEAHGFFVTEKNTLTGTTPKSGEAIEAEKVKLIARLTHVLHTGFNTFKDTFKEGVPDIAAHVITEADVTKLADEMIFFMGGEYMESLKTAALSGSLETYTPKKATTGEYEERLKTLFGPGVEVKPLIPLPEQQAAADGTHKQSLGVHGTFVSTIEEGGVTAESNTAAAVSGHDREVDLGFVNGPMPIAKLQEVIYKVVALGMVAVSD